MRFSLLITFSPFYISPDFILLMWFFHRATNVEWTRPQSLSSSWFEEHGNLAYCYDLFWVLYFGRVLNFHARTEKYNFTPCYCFFKLFLETADAKTTPVNPRAYISHFTHANILFRVLSWLHFLPVLWVKKAGFWPKHCLARQKILYFWFTSKAVMKFTWNFSKPFSKFHFYLFLKLFLTHLLLTKYHYLTVHLNTGLVCYSDLPCELSRHLCLFGIVVLIKPNNI